MCQIEHFALPQSFCFYRKLLTLSRRRSHFSADPTTRRRLRYHLINQDNFRNYRLRLRRGLFCETWLNITKWNVPSIRPRNDYIGLFSDIGTVIMDILDG